MTSDHLPSPSRSLTAGAVLAWLILVADVLLAPPTGPWHWAILALAFPVGLAAGWLTAWWVVERRA